MSHRAYVGVLAHHEPRTARPTSFIPADQAELLMSNLVVEQISRKIIRMLDPDSTFMNMPGRTEIVQRILGTAKTPPTVSLRHMPQAEIPGVKFQQPESQRILARIRSAHVREQWRCWRQELERAAC